MGTVQDLTASKPVVPSTPTRMRIFLSAARYLAAKALTILVSIFLAALITLMIVDVPVDVGFGFRFSPFQARLEQEIQWVIENHIYHGLIATDAHGVPFESEVQALERKLRREAGLDLPYVPRYMLWTYRALSFDWGELSAAYDPEVGAPPGLLARLRSSYVLQYLPNTLLLVGTTYLLVFLIGMPLSLYLARHYGGRLDRMLSILSPISSVPSWVFAMLLVVIFAVKLRWLPVAGMFDFHKPTELIPYVLTLLRHMILPVSAMVLSLLFQMVYTWRTFFIIYSEEDYVDLARAKGLDARLLEKQYILRPALPYVITSFVTSLIGFWQLTIALEKVFAWPGIGYLYIDVLPDFWQDKMAVGDLLVVVQIVIIFSYLLGLLVLLMDLAYVIVDPRIHLLPTSNLAGAKARSGGLRRAATRFFARMRRNAHRSPKPILESKRHVSWNRLFHNLRESGRDWQHRLHLVAEQLRMYPSAMLGLIIITVLVAGSLYAFAFLPYEEIGEDYSQKRSTGRNLRPRTAAPAWLNVLSSTPRLSTLILDKDSEGSTVTTETLENGWVQKTVTLRFDYQYREIPSDVFLYLESDYDEKMPFVSLAWRTPDGRTINLKNKAIGGDSNYDVQAGTPMLSLLADHPEWKSWFVTQGLYPTPVYQLLFAQPGATQSAPLQGSYELEITTLLFEQGSDLQPQLVLLGQVYGVAGTDFWRRDLLVSLFWGMPFALVVGFMGTLITSLIAILLPAIGVWFGGALDTFIQRLTEVNMVLPGLAIVVLAYALMGIHIWIVLAIVVVINALGAPIKTFRSAFLQAKEAPYIEMARSYGASNFRIISRYLVPRILPVIIPHLVMQIPTFIFLEATLGFFNIRSVYPSWGRIIYEGLWRGALYGSPFWVLQPIFLLLLTGFAFAMLGQALERILNPRIITDMPVLASPSKSDGQNPVRQTHLSKKVAAGFVVALIATALFVPVVQGKTLARLFMSYFDEIRTTNTLVKRSVATSTRASLISAPLPTEVPVTSTAIASTSQPFSSPAIAPPTATFASGVTCIPSNPQEDARVIEIVDGNTIKILMNDLVYVVRYIGVGAPQDQQNAFQAYLENSELVYRKDVHLIADSVDRDPSGRLLRYVLAGDTFVNQQLLERGHGMAVDIPVGAACSEAFRDAERSARDGARGLWSAPTPVSTPSR